MAEWSNVSKITNFQAGLTRTAKLFRLHNFLVVKNTRFPDTGGGSSFYCMKESLLSGKSVAQYWIAWKICLNITHNSRTNFVIIWTKITNSWTNFSKSSNIHQLSAVPQGSNKCNRMFVSVLYVRNSLNSDWATM